MTSKLALVIIAATFLPCLAVGCGASEGVMAAQDASATAGSAGTAYTDSSAGGAGGASGAAGSGGLDASAGSGGFSGTGGSSDDAAVDSEPEAGCTQGTHRCSGNLLQVCQPNGQWDAGTECSGKTPVCVVDACGCPGTGGPTMVGMEKGYCIDSTEVSVSHYAAWLSTSPPTSLMPPYCSSWKSAYTAAATTNLDHPAYVDWCDAYTYCKAMGKRLCGRIGGGSVNYETEFGDATKSQWFDACSSNGVNTFPYGSIYEPQTCNGLEHGAGQTVPVGTMPGCQSKLAGYKGVYDLLGNAWEWEDACGGQVGPNDACRRRGGDCNSSSDRACATGASWAYRNAVAAAFRCCAP